MALFSFLDPVLNVLFGWLLNLSPFWAVFILSFILSLMIVLIYKFTTNQSLMKSLKEEIKSLQKEMKTLKHDPDKMMKVNKRAMEVNMKYMGQSLKPMIFTLLPILIIFGWLNGHLAFEPIMPGEEFAVQIEMDDAARGNLTAIPSDGLELTSTATKRAREGTITYTFEAPDPGTYSVDFNINGNTYSKDILISEEREYIEPEDKIGDEVVDSIVTQHKKTRVIKFGDSGLTWLWSYIIFSMVFSLSLRRILKVY